MFDSLLPTFYFLRVEVASLRHSNSLLSRGEGKRGSERAAEPAPGSRASRAAASPLRGEVSTLPAPSAERAPASASANASANARANAAQEEEVQAVGIAASLQRHELRDRLAVAATEPSSPGSRESSGGSSAAAAKACATPTQRRPPHPHTPPARPRSNAKDGAAVRFQTAPRSAARSSLSTTRGASADSPETKVPIESAFLLLTITYLVRILTHNLTAPPILYFYF